MKISTNIKNSSLFSLILAILYIFVHDAYSIAYFLFKLEGKPLIEDIFFYSISSILLVILILLFIITIKSNFKESKTTKECFIKAGIFTLFNVITFIILEQLFSGIEAGVYLGVIIVGLFLINIFYYLTIIAYKIIMNR